MYSYIPIFCELDRKFYFSCQICYILQNNKLVTEYRERFPSVKTKIWAKRELPWMVLVRNYFKNFNLLLVQRLLLSFFVVYVSILQFLQTPHFVSNSHRFICVVTYCNVETFKLNVIYRLYYILRTIKKK